MKTLSLDPKIKEQKHAHHENRIEKYNYERQTCYVPVPPTLLTEVYLVFAKTGQLSLPLGAVTIFPTAMLKLLTASHGADTVFIP